MVYVKDKPVAYVNLEENKVIIEPKTGAIIEPCLMAYGLSINMGIDETVHTPRKLTGYLVKIGVPDVDEDYIVRAIRVCIAFTSGIKANIERIEKIYEVTSTKIKEGEEKGEDEITFETT